MNSFNNEVQDTGVVTETEQSSRSIGEGVLYTLIGLALIGFCYYLYVDLTQWEAEGGTRRMKWLFALAYDLAGKWGTIALVALGAAGALYHGISTLLGKKVSEDAE